MLEQMREQTGSFLIWVLFAIIIAAFVLFFGSPSDSLGCGSSKEYSLEVEDEQVSVNSWRFAYNGIPFIFGNNVPSEQRRPMALELLLQREILAQAAQEMDFNVSDSVIDEAIATGDFYLLGNRLDGTRIYFQNSEEEGYFFEYKFLENLVGRLGLPSMRNYKEEQGREILAYLMKQELLKSAYVSEEEARDNFIMANTTISADYVKFDVARYRSAIELSEEEVNAYIADHGKELETAWEQEKPRWESEQPRVRARIIKIAKATPDAAPPQAEGEEEEEEEEDAPKPEAASEDPARKTIEASREQILAGADFASVAKEVSEDRSASLGGLIGWRAAASMGYGQEVVDASLALAVGKVSAVIESGAAYFLVVIEEKSEKGLTLAQKKFDLAVKAAPDALARKRAKAAAEDALERAKTTSLAELFPKAPEAPTIDLNNLPAEIRDQLTPEQLQKLMESAAPNGETGALIIEGPTQLAQLGASEESEADPTEPVAKPKAAKPEAPKPEAPKPEAPLESAKPASALDTAETDVPPPNLQTIQGTTRNGDFIAGIGRSSELVEALFGELEVSTLAPKVYEVTESDGYVVIQLTDRTEADMEEFKKQASSLQATLAESKGSHILQTWVAQQCLKLKKTGSISYNQSLLTSGTDAPVAYEPCSLLTQAL